MEKRISIAGYTVWLRIIKVFDAEQGDINEHILAVDISSVLYDKELIQQAVGVVKRDHPDLKAIYYRVSADNYNTIYICPIVKSDNYKVPEIITSERDLEKYRTILNDLDSKY